MKKLNTLLIQLETKIIHYEKLTPSVSQSSVGWHIDHTLLATNRIIIALAQSKPEQYGWKFNLTRLFVFTINKIPRGKAKAPKAVQPQGKTSPEQLYANLETAKKKVETLNNLHSKNYFEHPYFGKLHLKSSIKFLEIHTQHHLYIIDDIINSL